MRGLILGARGVVKPTPAATEPPPPDNTAAKCHNCAHPWHGLACGKNPCLCPTAWVDPATLGAT